MARPIADIQQEYQQQAALLGHVTYQIAALEMDAARMRKHMRDLNKEAIKASAKLPADIASAAPAAAAADAGGPNE